MGKGEEEMGEENEIKEDKGRVRVSIQDQWVCDDGREEGWRWRL